ncbi:MAG: response regulator [Shimia sp.]
MRRIALIDDDRDLAPALGGPLARQGVDLIHFPQPRVALERFARAPDAFDLVMCDLRMPDLDGVLWDYAGLAVLPRVKAVVAPHVVVGILTGLRRDALDEAAARNGADILVQKSSDVDAMGAELCAALPHAPRMRRTG